MRLIFFHGLNTFGDDQVHVGPLQLGPMHAQWERALHRLYPQIEFIPALGLGSGTIHEQTAQARRFLEHRGLLAHTHATETHQIPIRLSASKSPFLNESAAESATVAAPLHFVGQSTGGLVARQLAHDPALRERVKSVITIGTPNHGATAAEFALQTFRDRPWLRELLKLGGYDLKQKLRVFADLTPSALKVFNERFDHRGTAPCFSLVCSLSRREIAWPLQVFYSQIHPDEGGESDGFISTSSQIFDRQTNASFDFCQGEFALDHFGELGFLLESKLRSRSMNGARAVQEFDRLIKVTAQIVSTRND